MSNFPIVEELTRLGPRPAGSEACDAAHGLLRESLANAGLDVETQQFRLVTYEPDRLDLRVDGVQIEAGPCMYSQPTPPGGVEGRLEFLGYDAFLPGLFEPLVLAIMDTSGNEVARIYGNPIEGGGAGAFASSAGPTLTGPAAYVGHADACRLRERESEQWASLVSGGAYRPGVEQRNLVARLPGAHAQSIIVSAHYDSAWGATGAVDNATGVEAVVRLAKELATRPERPVTYTFALFAAEEAGLAGARAFVHRARPRGELESLLAVVNIDSIGAGKYLKLMAGPDDILEVTRTAVNRLRLADRHEVQFLPPGPGSDHFPFTQEGIPAASISFFPYPQYHLPTDVLSLVDPATFKSGVALARMIIDEVAQSVR
jgi:hypothetical protein